MAKKPKRRPASSFTSQASKDALVRFGGSQQQLNELLAQAQGTYRQTVSAARGGALVQQRAIDQTLPQVQTAYDDAIKRRGALTAGLNADLAGLGGGIGKDIVAATQLESSGALGRIADEKARNVTDLGSQRVRATQGAVYAGQQARNTLASDLAKIYGKQSTLTDQIGAYTQSQADKYSSQDFGDQVKGANYDLAAAKEKRIAAGEGGKGGKKDKRTALEHGTLQDAVNPAADYVRRLAKTGASREEIAQILSTGKLPKDAVKAGVPPPPGKLGSLGYHMAIHLALDKGLTRRDVKILHDRGYSVNTLGYKTQKKPKPKSLGQWAKDYGKPLKYTGK